MLKVCATYVKLYYCCACAADGRTFGELALLNDNCVRSASIIADETSDLIVISRDLYNRSVAKIVGQEYQEKLDFVNSCSLFRSAPCDVRLYVYSVPVHMTCTSACDVVYYFFKCMYGI